MKLYSLTVISACLAGSTIALPTMQGLTSTNKQAEHTEINNKHADSFMEQRVANILDNRMNIVCCKQGGTSPPGGSASDVADTAPTIAVSDVASADPTATPDLPAAAPSSAGSAPTGTVDSITDAASAAP